MIRTSTTRAPSGARSGCGRSFARLSKATRRDQEAACDDARSRRDVFLSLTAGFLGIGACSGEDGPLRSIAIAAAEEELLPVKSLPKGAKQTQTQEVLDLIKDGVKMHVTEDYRSVSSLLRHRSPSSDSLSSSSLLLLSPLQVPPTRAARRPELRQGRQVRRGERVDRQLSRGAQGPRPGGVPENRGGPDPKGEGARREGLRVPAGAVHGRRDRLRRLLQGSIQLHRSDCGQGKSPPPLLTSLASDLALLLAQGQGPDERQHHPPGLRERLPAAPVGQVGCNGA